VAWDLEQKKIRQILRLEQGERPKGISYIPQKDLILVIARRQFYLFDPKTGRLNEKYSKQLPNSILTEGSYCAHLRLVAV
jgi:hypothetical protein